MSPVSARNALVRSLTVVALGLSLGLASLPSAQAVTVQDHGKAHQAAKAKKNAQNAQKGKKAVGKHAAAAKGKSKAAKAKSKTKKKAARHSPAR